MCECVLPYDICASLCDMYTFDSQNNAVHNRCRSQYGNTIDRCPFPSTSVNRRLDRDGEHHHAIHTQYCMYEYSTAGRCGG
jgi:hypothetical protein